ncbi:MAG: serine hydroxymethyltransferase [Candidatus Thermoplasmatota archaeon]
MTASLFIELARRHDHWRTEECINLIPSENIVSPQVRSLLSSDMGGRYTLPIGGEVHGVHVENAYRGTRYADEVQRKAEALACRIFHAAHATLAPLSGHLAGMLMLSSLCRKGDTVLTLSSGHGGYDGYCEGYMPDLLGLKVAYLPFHPPSCNIRVEEACAMIHAVRPRLVILGASYFPFPHPVRELAAACSEADAALGYDAAHVLGLIPIFQHPLAEGAAIVVGNTHKTFWGPQGGIAMTNSPEIWDAMLRNLTWRTVDNTHLHRIAAVGHALLEFERFGAEYAAQVVRNAKALAGALDDHGIPIRFREHGYTASHQVLLDPERMPKELGLDCSELAIRLERSNIITDALGRLGTQEITRMGLREKEMSELADLISQCAGGKDVSDGVKALRERMQMCYVLS